MSIRKLLLFLVFVILLSGCAQESKTTTPTPTPEKTPSETGTPVYSGSKVYSAPTFYYQLLGIPTEGVTVHIYYTEEADVEKILNWYKEKLKDYEIVEDIAIVKVGAPQGSVEWGAVIFKKENRAVGIWAMSGASIEGGKGTVYYVVEGPIEELISETAQEKEGEELPPSDVVSGEEPIKRYAGAVMLSYEKTEGFPTIIMIDYGTKNDSNAVFEWYKQYLKSEGWEISSESKEEDRMSIDAKKGSERIGVIIYPPSADVEYTQISIHYGSYKLPSSDVVKGEEPIPRYPASVMLEHTSMTMGGGKTITIKYGSNDSPDKIMNWYVSELQKEGWQIMSQGKRGEILSLVAFKESASVQIEVSKNGYTEINVMYTGI